MRCLKIRQNFPQFEGWFFKTKKGGKDETCQSCLSSHPGILIHKMKSLGSDNPAALRNWMAAAEEKTGSDVLTIARNSTRFTTGVFHPIRSRPCRAYKSHSTGLAEARR